ncbi:Fur family transcriptional regulator, ferric uptake regulator [Desulfobaculum bizertense DSM 18034]|uniref:Fur family transcriptional regulator, ferric uptake regulator n=2 Tax=Desulfobaculum TaxID=1433996 RepID=A0A1T4VDL0_9BACT|nr:transcriptional repressor [Desulfobaculum bizertense]SKA62976.1 Fur family transcriptional regulator, ferric uptake regulator [Desulfobaculum bizertense DSM 18034]
MEAKRPKRMTKQRKIILEELRKLTSHPTADELYEIVRARLPRVSLGTVYRNLEVLSEQGDILKLESAGSQKRFDGNPEPHYHIRCVQCGRVGDVEHDGEVVLPSMEHFHCEGFTIHSQSLEFYGLCADCQEKLEAREAVGL